MANLLLLFNHIITSIQEEDAHKSLDVEDIVLPPEAISRAWAQLPAEAEKLFPLLTPVRQWLAAHACPGDYVLIQGDFGACYLMVEYARRQGYVPVYSTTRRDAVEKRHEDGTVEIIHAFRHVCFRRYGQ